MKSVSLPPFSMDRGCFFFGNGSIQKLATFLGQPRAGQLLDRHHLHQQPLDLAARGARCIRCPTRSASLSARRAMRWITSRVSSIPSLIAVASLIAAATVITAVPLQFVYTGHRH
jgi:hypothetical protein